MAVSISLAITQNSQNVTSNTSNVTVKATVKWTYGSWNATGECYGSITIDGTKYSFTGLKFNTSASTSGSQVIMTKTVNVSHSSDGTKSLTASTSFYTGLKSGTITAEATKTLTTIPRKSSLSVANGTLGTSQTLTVTRQSTSFTHSIKAVCGSSTLYIKADGSTSSSEAKHNDCSIPFVPPISWASQNKTGSSVSVTYTITTYSGSTNVGSNSYTKTCSIPSSVKPSVSLSVSDPMGYADKYGAYVQGMSKMNIVATASGSYGSTIKSYKTTADGKTYTVASATTGVISGKGTLTISTTVTDSRARTNSASTTVSVLEYSFPKITALSVYRCDADGSANSSGEYLAVKFSSVVTSLNSKNTAVYTVKYKKSSATSYTTKTIPDFAGQYSVSDGVYVFPAETAFSYDVTLTVNDDFKSTPKSTTGSSVKKLWSMLKKAGEIVGIAINKIAELEGVFDVDMVIRARRGIIVDSEWIDLTLTDDFAIYNGIAEGHPRYKVTGNVVTVMGIVTPTKEFTSGMSQVIIATGIPHGLHPPTTAHFICQGSGMNRWSCAINPTAGTVGLSRYGTTEATTVPVGAWLPFCVTYQIG